MKYGLTGTIAGTMLLTTSIVAAQSGPPQFPKQKPQAQQRKPQFQQPQQIAAQAPPAAPRGQNANSNAVAFVNGDPITKPEFQERLQQSLQGLQPGPDGAAAVKQQTLNSLIESRLVEQYVRQSEEVSVDEKQVDATISRVKSQLASQQVEFDAYLSSRGYTETLFRKRVEGSLGWQQYQQQQLELDKLKAFFEKNRKQFPPDQSFEESQRQVAQAYTASLWSDIVSTAKPRAEIKIVEPGLRPAQPKADRRTIPQQIPR